MKFKFSRIFTVVSFAVLQMSFEAFADFRVIDNLNANSEVELKINNYLSSRSCMGNNRASRIEYLDVVAQDTPEGRSYSLQGRLWGNSWQRGIVKTNGSKMKWAFWACGI